VREGGRQFAPLNAFQREELQSTHRYVLVPDALILAFANDPLAVGVYAAIARLVVATKDAVPLAARDLAAWMGSEREADRAAIMRRIAKLGARGWLMITRTKASKHHVLPTWGMDRMGIVRPWQLNRSDSGRPAHIRGRRLPLGVLDDYVGRLDPQPGQRHALISRYFTRPLLDLADIGVYVIGLRAEVTPTSRLRHLGLHTLAGVTAPADGQSLIVLAAAGQLTTVVDNSIAPVHLSFQGQARLGIASTIAAASHTDEPERPCGSLSGSLARSAGRSDDIAGMLSISPQQDTKNVTYDDHTLLIAWDVGNDHEQINHDPSPELLIIDGGGAAAVGGFSGATLHAQCDCQRMLRDQQRCSAIGADRTPVGLAASLVTGHRTLNSDRRLHAGEWHELLVLQERYGADQLLIWQARASRVKSERPYGITPAYYRACAASAASDAYRPSSHTHGRDVLAEPTGYRVEPPLSPDPACDALLASMGVRERQKLAAVPYALIASWQTALAHPGLAAQFASPIGFAVAQMQRGNSPPPITELDRWDERARRTGDRYESWRYIDPVTAGDLSTDEQQLEARVRALAPPDADLETLCALACVLEAGASDAEALAQLPSKASATIDGRKEKEQVCARRSCG
jgi:hypothetical protein